MNRILASAALLGVTAWAASGPLLAAEADRKAPVSERAETQPMKDAFIKGRIVSAYALNANVSAFDLDVKVENGIAYVGGTVDTPVERDLAVEIARGVDDVRDVRSTIKVKSGTREARDSSRRSAGQVVDDATATATIKSKLVANDSIAGTKINVTTRNGVVTLTGTVNSEAEKDLAGRIAENTEPVAEVRNQLTVAGQRS